MKLSNYSVNLKHKISIYVPSTIDVNKTIDNTFFVNRTCKYLSTLFGGCTASPASGKWFSDEKGLISENVTICFAYCTEEDFLKSEEDIISFSKGLCKKMSQECISVSYDNELFFIS